MHFKLLIVFNEDDKTNAILEAAREAGATGATVLHQAVGEGVEKQKTFFGLTLATQRDVLLLVVEEHMSRQILETIARVGEFETKHSKGIAIQVDIEDAVGISHQIRELEDRVGQEAL